MFDDIVRLSTLAVNAYRTFAEDEDNSALGSILGTGLIGAGLGASLGAGLGLGALAFGTGAFIARLFSNDEDERETIAEVLMKMR